MLKILLIKDNVGTDIAAALIAVRNSFLCHDIFSIKLLATLHAVIPEH